MTAFPFIPILGSIANLSFHIILNPTRADFLQNHGKSASFLCWENERKHLILLTFFNVTLL